MHFASPRAGQIGVCMLLICALNIGIPEVLGAAGHANGSAALMALMVPIGCAQALLNPALHKLVSSWAPTNERTRMHNTIYAGQSAGKMVAPISSSFIAAAFGWEAVFWTNGVLCGCFAVVWLLVVEDSPAVDARCNPAERALIAADGGGGGLGAAHSQPGLCDLPWGKVLMSPAFWAILVNHFVSWKQRTTVLHCCRSCTAAIGLITR